MGECVGLSWVWVDTLFCSFLSSTKTPGLPSYFIWVLTHSKEGRHGLQDHQEDPGGGGGCAERRAGLLRQGPHLTGARHVEAVGDEEHHQVDPQPQQDHGAAARYCKP